MNTSYHKKYSDYLHKTIDIINLLLPPCNLDPKQIDGGNSLIRILAISCVLLIHLHTYLKPWISFDQLISCCTYCCFWAVPAFVCLSGKQIPIQIPYQTFYKKKFYRIFIPTIFWSIIFSLFLIFKSKYSLKSIFISYLNCGPFFHLWFMYMLCGLYLLAPFCSIFIIKIPFLYLIPFAIIIMFKPTIWDNPPWRYSLLLSLPYIFMFITGGLISRLHITKKIGLLSCFSALLYLLFMVGVATVFLNSKQAPQYPFFHYLSFFGYWGGTSLTVSLLWLGTFLTHNTKVILFKFSQLVFGVYFIHPIVISFLIKLINFKSLNTISFFFIYFIYWLLCFIIVICLKKIKFLQQFI